MKGMETMLAGMLGIKPEQMQAMAAGMSKAATEGVTLLQRIDANVAELLELTKARENGER